MLNHRNRKMVMKTEQKQLDYESYKLGHRLTDKQNVL